MEMVVQTLKTAIPTWFATPALTPAKAPPATLAQPTRNVLLPTRTA